MKENLGIIKFWDRGLTNLMNLVPIATCSQAWTSAALIEAYEFSMTIYRKRRRTLVCCDKHSVLQ